MDGVFWHGNIGYVIDKQKMPSTFPDGNAFDAVALEPLLTSAELPRISPAPLASWLLARLMKLTRDGLGFDTDDKIYNDGGGYYLNVIAFSREMRPLAFFYIHGTSSYCSCWGQTAREVPPNDLIPDFVAALSHGAIGRVRSSSLSARSRLK